MSEEDDRNLAIALQMRAKLRKGREEFSIIEAVADPFRGFNRGVSLAIGMPVDMMNNIAGAVGFDVEEPVLGSAWIARQMNKAGVGTEAKHLKGPARVMESVGAAAVPVGILGAVANTGRQAVQAASGPISAAGREILSQFRRNPTGFAAAESGIAAAGGTGAAIAQEVAPGNPVAEVGGELLGALTPAALAKTPTPRVINSLRNQIAPLVTEKGRRRLAGNSLKQISENPEAVARTLDVDPLTPEGADLTVAQETGDRGLLTLEKATIRANAQNERLYGDMADTTRKAMDKAAEELADSGSPSAPREILDSQVLRMESLLDERIASAQQAAANKIDDLGGINTVERRQSNVIAQTELDNALKDARAQETDLWNAVPDHLTTSTSGAVGEYKNIITSRAETANAEDIPAYVHEWLSPDKAGKSKIGSENTVLELRTLRSRMLDDIRAERGKKSAANRKKIGILDQLQGSILDDLGGIPDDSLTLAREFSFALNKKFFDSPIGRLLHSERSGGKAVAPEVALETTIGQRGPQAGVNAKALMKAANDSPQMREAIATHLKQRFTQNATDNGAIVPRRAEAFLRNNGDILEQFPDVRDELEDALLTQGSVSDITKNTKIDRAVIHDKHRNIAAVYLGAKPSRQINAVLEASPDKVHALKNLWARMEGDAAGEAGLKAAFVREMFGRAELSKLDADGVAGIDPKKLRRDFKADASAAKEAGWFSDGEINRLDEIITTLQKIDVNRSAGRSLEELVELPLGSGIIDLLVRMTAARAGAVGPLSGSAADLQTAGFAARSARRITALAPTEKIRSLVSGAVFDRNLYNDLIRVADSPEETARINRRLNAWMVNLGVDREEDQ